MKLLIESCRRTLRHIFLLVRLIRIRRLQLMQPPQVMRLQLMQHRPLRSSWLAIVACLNMDRCPTLGLVDPSPTRNLIQPLTSRSKDP